MWPGRFGRSFLPPRRNPRANTPPAARNCSGLYVGKQPFRPPMQIRFEFDTTVGTQGESITRTLRCPSPPFAAVSEKKTNFSPLIVLEASQRKVAGRENEGRNERIDRRSSSFFPWYSSCGNVFLRVRSTNYLSSRCYAELVWTIYRVTALSQFLRKQSKVNGELTRDVTSCQRHDCRRLGLARPRRSDLISPPRELFG